MKKITMKSVRKVVFYDDLDFGKKTESYGYYSLAPASISGTSVENGK